MRSKTDQAALGFMETDWAENRAKIPQDIIRSTIGKLLDNLYSTGEQDKFRTRLERNADGGTDLFVSHRGMVEVYAVSAREGSTTWQPRPADSGLETEFLKRIMLKIGGASDLSKTAPITATVAPASSKVSVLNGQPAVELNEGFDRAWRRVGLSLDRTGFTVEDRDRSKGTYFVRYVEPSTKKQEPGFFSKIFSGTPATVAPLKLRVLVTSAESLSKITVQNNDGTVASEVVAQRIVKVLADDLK
jgi:outer membrane protein assembly factor BamC